MHLFGIWLLLFLGRGQCQDTSFCAEPEIPHGIATHLDPDDIVVHPYEYEAFFKNDTIMSVECSHGYRFIKTNQTTGRIRCLAGNSGHQWVPSAKDVCRDDCLRPSMKDLSGRFIQLLTFDARDQMVFGCTRRNFLMFGDRVVRCLNAIWSLPLPVCRFKSSCLLRINNGIVTRNRTDAARPPLGPWARPHDDGVVHCDTGYAISGGIKHVKCKRGKWDPEPTCMLPACIIPPSVTAGRPRFTSRGVSYTSHQTFPHGRYLNIECPNGKVLTSTMEKPAITVHCTFGDWSNSTVFTEKCEPDPCEGLNKVEQKASIIQYGMIPRTLSDGKRYVRHGTEINFTCKRGYHVKDSVYSGIVECRSGRYYDQQQEQSQLCCKKPAKCQKPTISNGVMSLASVQTTPATDGDENYVYGNYDYPRLYEYGDEDVYDDQTTVGVECGTGYWFNGTNGPTGTITCQACEARWDPDPTEVCSPGMETSARKIFLSRQEWASFLGQGCCSPMRDLGYAWNSEICPLDWPWSFPTISPTDSQTNLLNECSRPSPCLRQEVEEYSRLGYDDDERMQVWAALRGVKVPKFGNRCCWTDTSTTYQCYEYPSSLIQ